MTPQVKYEPQLIGFKPIRLKTKIDRNNAPQSCPMMRCTCINSSLTDYRIQCDGEPKIELSLVCP